VEEERAEGTGSWVDLLKKENKMINRTFLGASLQFFQQLSGINAIMFFAPAMFNRFFSETVALYGTLAINIVNFLATFITFATVDKLGRVALMVSSGAGMCIAHMVVAVLASMPETEAVGIIVISFSCVFVIFFAYGWGPVTWTVCSEIYPQKLRGKAISVSTATNWGFATIVGKLFPIISAPSALDLTGTFALFAIFCFIGTIVMYAYLPETANATLEEIDEIFADHKPKLARAFWKEAQRESSIDAMVSKSFTISFSAANKC
jgi:SP family sugar:H+ symporter-like MFS transporter